ncbi:MAG: response regulator [Bryobacteraceae bacterium]|jgi:DNA-binding response OmpR family regulator
MATSGQPADVFIVEDNDPDVFLVEEALRSQGIPVQMQRCQDGEEAIQALSQIGDGRLPDIIIIDLNLPRVTGLEILKHVRSLKQLDAVPVLILTSSQSKTDRALSLQLGADAYIAKPPTLPEFLSGVGSGIRALLERNRTEPRARLHPAPAWTFGTASCSRGSESALRAHRHLQSRDHRERNKRRSV